VQQKASTDNAVVKPGKLYKVQCYVYWSVVYSIKSTRSNLQGVNS